MPDLQLTYSDILLNNSLLELIYFLIKDALSLNINNQVGLVIHNGQVFESCLVWSKSIYLSIFKYCLRPREHFWQALRVRVMKKKKIKE